MNPTFFETPAQFRVWLEQHHKTEKVLTVGFYKVGSGKASVTWSQSVDQALCFGWIDGVRKSVDAESYSIRFTPRRLGSIWSAVNIRKVSELKLAGLMQPAGLKAFSLRTEDRSGIYSHEQEPAALDQAFEDQFKKDKAAWEFFTRQPPSYRKVTVHWIMSAKQEKTRQSRLTKTIEASANGERLP